MLRVDWHRLKGYAPLCFITLGIVLWRVTAPFAVILPWIISAMLKPLHVLPCSSSYGSGGDD